MPRTKQQTELIRAESREKIVSTARRLFAERGYDGCNVSDIARAAGMSQGNIYWYFPAKRDIFSAVLEEGFRDLGAGIAEAASGAEPAAEKLRAFLGRFFGMVKEQAGQEFFAIIMTLSSQGAGLPLEDFGISKPQIGAGYHQSLNAIFAQGQAEGAFLQGVDPNLMSTFLFSFVNGLMLMYPDEWKNIPEEIIYQAIGRLVGAAPA